MNITGFGYGSEVTLASAGGVSLVADGAGPDLQTMGLTAGANVTLTPGASSVTIAAASGTGVYLRLSGADTMAGDMKMGTHNITGAGSVNGIAAGNIVSNTGSGTAGNIPTFVSAKVVGDSGTALSSLASTSSLSAYLPKAGGAMSGNLTMNAAIVMNSTGVYGVSLLEGTTTSRNANDLIGDVGNGVTGNLSMYSGVSGGKFISDAGISAAVVVQSSGAGAVGNLASIANVNGKVIADSGVVAANVVTGPASATSGRLVTYNGPTGKVINDSGVLASSVVTGPASAVVGNVVTFSNTNGKQVVDSGAALSAYARLANPTFTGTVTTPSVTLNSTSGIIGTTTNNSATAGSVGEYVTASAASLGLTTGVITNVTSISLTAGDWKVWGSVGFLPASTATVFFGGISSTTVTLPSTNSGVRMSQVASFPSGQGQAAYVGQTRFSLSATTTIYLVIRVDFVSTCTCDGYIGARRVR